MDGHARDVTRLDSRAGHANGRLADFKHALALALFHRRSLIEFMEVRHRRPLALALDCYVESPIGDGVLGRAGFVPDKGLGAELALVPPAESADLFEPSTRAVAGRADPADITVFNNSGGGHIDQMAAHFLVKRARAAIA